jgi:hypothetical protein
MTLESARRTSRGFRNALLGLAITIFGYFGAWEWPAWPAFWLLDVVFGSGSSWIHLSSGTRDLVLVALIAFNTATWAVVVWALSSIARHVHGRLRSRRAASS